MSDDIELKRLIETEITELLVAHNVQIQPKIREQCVNAILHLVVE